MEKTHYFIYICFIVGLVNFIFSWLLYKKSISTKTWHLCKGKILHSSVEKSQVGEDTPSYRAKINYEYTVDNQTYFSKRIYYGCSLYKFNGYRKEANSLVKRFKAGAIVDVFYDPKKPKQSVLIQGINSIVYIVFFAGCLTTLMAIFLMVYY